MHASLPAIRKRYVSAGHQGGLHLLMVSQGLIREIFPGCGKVAAGSAVGAWRPHQGASHGALVHCLFCDRYLFGPGGRGLAFSADKSNDNGGLCVARRPLRRAAVLAAQAGLLRRLCSLEGVETVGADFQLLRGLQKQPDIMCVIGLAGVAAKLLRQAEQIGQFADFGISHEKLRQIVLPTDNKSAAIASQAYRNAVRRW